MKRSAILALLLLCACVSKPPTSSTTTSRAEPEEKTSLQRAEEMMGANNYEGAREALLEHIDDEPDNAQARYLLAKTLAFLGELRGAKAEVGRVIELKSDNPLAWDLLGSLHEQLGEHEQALEAYLEVQKRTDSLAPILAIARCQLYMGQPEAALSSLEAARTRKKKDPWTEFFTYEALKRMGRKGDAEAAARDYLDLATGEPDHATYVSRVRSWLDEERTRLEPRSQQAMVDFVRTATRLRLPDAEPPENEVLARAPERLFIFDDRPVFVTLFPQGSGERFRGVGRGRSLASALKGAVAELQEQPGFAPLKVRKAAVRIDVGSTLEPITLRRDAGRLIATPAVEPGRHGVGLRADGQEVYCFVGDAVSDDLPDLMAMLDHACTTSGLAPKSWQTATGALFRFDAESFLSPAPGIAPGTLNASEPGPKPQATLTEIQRAKLSGARWLTTLLQPETGIASGYSPARNAFDSGGDVPVALADAHTAARAAYAFAAVRPDGGDAVLMAARDHLAAGKLLPPNAKVRAWRLAALSVGPAKDPHDALRARMAELLLDPPAEARAEAGVALAIFGARDRNRKWRKAVARLSKDVQADGLPEVELLLRSALRDTKLAGRVLDWAKAQLESAPPAAGPERARWVAALAGAARVAREQGHASAARLRSAVLENTTGLLELQLGQRHAWFCAEPPRALGGFRRDLGISHLDPIMTAECLLALVAVEELLTR